MTRTRAREKAKRDLDKTGKTQHVVRFEGEFYNSDDYDLHAFFEDKAKIVETYEPQTQTVSA